MASRRSSFPFRPLLSPSFSSRHRVASTHAPSLSKNLPYFVPRNTNGNLPVYSDIRNNGTRYLVLIRNVDGRAHALAQDLRTTLFKAASSKAARAKVEITHGKNIVITSDRWKNELTGGRCKNELTEWLKARGF